MQTNYLNDEHIIALAPTLSGVEQSDAPAQEHEHAHEHSTALVCTLIMLMSIHPIIQKRGTPTL